MTPAAWWAAVVATFVAQGEPLPRPGSCGAAARAAGATATRPCLLHGRVKFVEHFPDYKIRLVEHFPDARVQLVEHFPDRPGRWQVVEHFPDFTVQVVEHFPDFTVEQVEHFPGCP